jgi:hypothetical protein
MRYKTLLQIILAFSISLLSCEQIRFIEIDEADPKLVLNGIMSPALGLWVNVSESKGATTPLAQSFIPVEDAIINIYNQDELLTTVSENNQGNYFTSDFHPVEGNTYRIDVDANGIAPVQTQISIPRKVEIAEFDTTVVFVHPGEYIFYTDIAFMDPPETGNYYMLGAFYVENERLVPISVDIEDLDANIYIHDGINVVAYSDENFNGGRKAINSHFHMYWPPGSSTTILIRLYSIEKAYYEYMKSYSQNFTILNEDMILYEPVLVSSNIEGGFGIISGVSYSSVAFTYEF